MSTPCTKPIYISLHRLGELSGKARGTLVLRISAEAAQILRPVIDRILEHLHAEHARRREEAEPVVFMRRGR